MKSLYDVFKAIQADEGDHVKTMVACLDPDIAVQSPSLEQKVLLGAALMSSAALAASTGYIDMPDIDFLNNILDAGSNVAVDDTTVDVVAGAGAAFFSQFFEEENEASLAAEAIEAGSLLFVLKSMQRFAAEFFAVIARFLTSLL